MAVKTAIKQAIYGVSGVVMISKMVGFLREMVIADRFGTTSQYDIYLLAITIPIFFNVVMVRTVNFFAVPFLTKMFALDNKAGSRHDIWSVYTSMLVIVITLVAGLTLAAPFLVRFIGGNMNPADLEQGVMYCRYATILVFLGFHESFLRSALNVKKHFVYPVSGVIIFNVLVIASIFLFAGSLSVGSILAGFIFGLFVQNIFLLLKLFDLSFVRYLNFQMFNKTVRDALKIGSIIIMIELMLRTFFMIDRFFAADLSTGVVSALNYSSMLVMLPLSVIGFAVASVFYPYLSEAAGQKSKGEFVSLLKSALAMIVTVGLPIGLFYIIFNKEIVAAVFLRGAFDLHSLELTSRLLFASAPGLAALFLYLVLVQSCYSLGLQKQVLYIAGAALLIKILITWLFVRLFDFPGLAWATSSTHIFMSAALMVTLARKGYTDKFADLLILIGKLILATLPFWIIGYYYQTLPEYSDSMNLLSKLRVIWAVLIGTILFGIIGYLLKIEVIRQFLGQIRGSRS